MNRSWQALVFSGMLLATLSFIDRCRADCPLQIVRADNIIEIKYPPVDFKIEPRWVKVRIHGAFDDQKWNWAPLDGGAARVSAFFIGSGGRTKIGELYTIKSGSSFSWFLMLRANPGSGHQWILATEDNGHLSCDELSSAENALEPRVAAFAGIPWRRAVVEIQDPKSVYERLGWTEQTGAGAR